MPSTVEQLEPATFEPLVGRRFQVFPPVVAFTVRNCPTGQTEPSWRETPVELELIEVTRYPRLKAQEGGFEHRPREPFALLFLGPHDPAKLLESSLHLVRQAELGEVRLFLNPVQISMEAPVELHPRGRFYECVFG